MTTQDSANHRSARAIGLITLGHRDIVDRLEPVRLGIQPGKGEDQADKEPVVEAGRGLNTTKPKISETR